MSADASTGERRDGERGTGHLVRAPIASLHAEPDGRATVTSQALHGETVHALDEIDGRWLRVRAALDGYEGFVERAALDGDAPVAPTHVVTARATLLFPGPGIKAAPAVRLPLGARLAPMPDAAPTHEDLVECTGAGWVHATHLAPLDAPPRHPSLLDAAAAWLDAPYLWGGRTPDGCDCSGLVQGAARACGLELPRDSGPQERTLGDAVPLDARRPNDLVFWPGHVAIVESDPALVLHANAHTLSVAVEPLADVIDRAGAPSSVRRPPVGPSA